MLNLQYSFRAEGHFAELAVPEAAAESKKKKSMALNFSAQFLPQGLERVFFDLHWETRAVFFSGKF